MLLTKIGYCSWLYGMWMKPKMFLFCFTEFLNQAFYMTHTFDSEVSLHYWLPWPTARRLKIIIIICSRLQLTIRIYVMAVCKSSLHCKFLELLTERVGSQLIQVCKKNKLCEGSTYLYLKSEPNTQSQRKTLSGHRKAGSFKIFAVSQGK